MPKPNLKLELVETAYDAGFFDSAFFDGDFFHVGTTGGGSIERFLEYVSPMWLLPFLLLPMIVG